VDKGFTLIVDKNLTVWAVHRFFKSRRPYTFKNDMTNPTQSRPMRKMGHLSFVRN
jgi:hypothetical protein